MMEHITVWAPFGGKGLTKYMYVYVYKNVLFRSAVWRMVLRLDGKVQRMNYENFLVSSGTNKSVNFAADDRSALTNCSDTFLRVKTLMFSVSGFLHIQLYIAT